MDLRRALPDEERVFFIDNLLILIPFIIVNTNYRAYCRMDACNPESVCRCTEPVCCCPLRRIRLLLPFFSADPFSVPTRSANGLGRSKRARHLTDACIPKSVPIIVSPNL